MATTIDPKLFSQIMALPKAERLDLLEFAGAATIGTAQLGRMVADLMSQPVDPGDGTLEKVA
jgi:hypothetical protein